MLRFKKYNNNAVSWLNLEGDINVSLNGMSLTEVRKEFLHNCEKAFDKSIENSVLAEYKNCRG